MKKICKNCNHFKHCVRVYNPYSCCVDYEAKPLTNEEWFDTLPTKEKAEWLDKVAENCCQICDKENRELCRRNVAIGCKFENAKKWELWLKQPHTPKE